MARFVSVLLCSAILAGSAGADAADLTIWWDKGFFPEEDAALQELVSGFERQTGKTVEVEATPVPETLPKLVAALAAGEPPDVGWTAPLNRIAPRLAFEDRLTDLSDILGPREADLLPAASDKSRMRNGKTGQRAYYALPIGQSTTHIHVWRSLVDAAGIDPESIPASWDEFWAFWCDRVQPAVRSATGREDIFGVGLPMSPANDTTYLFAAFISAYGADYVSSTGELLIDNPEVRGRLRRAMESYTGLYIKGCTPPDAVSWSDVDNNKSFHAQQVVMTANATLSIVGALKASRPEDYQRNTMTIAWPKGPGGDAFPIEPEVFQAVVFKDADHVDAAKEFVGYLLSDGRLGAFLQRTGRFVPVTRADFEMPFWQQSADPHLVVSVAQLAERAPSYTYIGASGNPNYGKVNAENVWAKAVHRVAADKISPDDAVNEAILRVKQILSE